MQPYALIHVRRPREHAKRLPGDIGQPDEEPAGKASRAGTAPLARQGARGQGIERQGHRTGDPLPEPRPAENTRRGSATCKRPPATLPAWQAVIGDASRAAPNAKRPPGPRGGRRPLPFAAGGKTPADERGGPSRVPLSQVLMSRLPAPCPRNAPRGPAAPYSPTGSPLQYPRRWPA